MKKRLFNHLGVAIILMAMALSTSCKKSSTASEDIVGTWTAGTTSLNVMVGNKTLEQYFIDELGLTADEAQAYVALMETSIKQNFTGTITIKSDNTYTTNMGGSTETGTWSMNADKTELTITPTSGTPTTATIVQLTSSTLHIQITETASEDINLDGTPETITIQADVTFNK